jgi:protein involved in polysaccharide export with SLBB domain
MRFDVSRRAGLGSFVDYRYIIGPGDNVNIIVWRNPELSMSVPVRPDGLIAGPLIEDMPAMGKTPTALARDMEKGAWDLHSGSDRDGRGHRFRRNPE